MICDKLIEDYKKHCEFLRGQAKFWHEQAMEGEKLRHKVESLGYTIEGFLEKPE